MDFYMKSPDLLLLAQNLKNTLQAKQNTRVRWIRLGLIPAASPHPVPGTSQPQTGPYSTAVFSGASCGPGEDRCTPQGTAGDLGQLGTGCAG